jgi:uncharacterized protein
MNGDNGMKTKRSERAGEGAPWWRFPMVWMLISGPAVVVVAGFATLWLAIRIPDPVIDEDYYQHGLDINKTLMSGKAGLPAEVGRNHAATPSGALPARAR